MATAATIKKNIAKLEAALKSKATPKSLKPKLETQLVKSKAELSGMNKGTKPKTSSTKSTQTALQKLKAMVNKNKKYKTYKGAGVDLEKDADRPALRTGKRIAKESGKTYYEYRANRIDVKQPPKKYPKLEKGGYMADGGSMDVVNAEIYTIRRNIMGTTSFMMKIKGMRNPQNFSVYPISADQAGQPITIQSDTRFGFLDLSSGRGLMSQSHANGAYSHHFTMDKKVPFKISETDLQRLKDHISGTAGSSVGNMGISSDNSGASMMAYGGYMAKGGQTDDFYDNLQVHVQGVGTIYHGQSMKAAIKKADAYLLKNPKAEVVIVDEKYGDEYDLEGNQIENEDEYAKGGITREGNHLMHFEPYFEKNVQVASIDEDLKIIRPSHGYWHPNKIGKKSIAWAKRNGYKFMQDGKEFEDGGYMAKGGEFKPYGKTKGKFKIEYVEDGEKQSEIWESKEMVEDRGKKLLKLGCTEIKITEMAKGGYYADGGISDKEVAESNAEMVLSQIKAVKHHAQELSNVVSKNSDIEAWVVAKIERASTDLSDITHYLEFQTTKMAMGGEIHRTQD